MRTLLIDNHDSFTYNLYQYLAACNAELPLVVRNDEMSWDDVERLAFDNIVISPGPGRPQRASDLGISADALRRSRVPVLGVCLGHQAIAHHCGATVDLAMRPMHGRIDRIAHAQRDLFRGIPDRFEAVRYHSLAVTALPRSLEPLAWTSDGTLMALRHLSRPWWGVQFHPESICTEFGARLLRNFRDLTTEWLATGKRSDTMGSFLPDFASQRQPALTVHARCVDVLPSSEAVFAELFAQSNASFWLDSSLAEQGRARFSFMGDATGPRAKTVTYRASTGELSVQTEDGVQVMKSSVLDYLQAELKVAAPVGTVLPFDFSGGYVGYFGYELKRELGGRAAHESETPDAVWILADRFLAFDHAEQQTWIVCLDNEKLTPANRIWLDTLAARLQQPWATPSAAPTASTASLASLGWRIDLSDYRERILRCQHEILQGETYEICLTNQLIGEGTIDAFAVYRALRSHNPAPYAAFLRSGELAVLCASPELFLRIASDRTVDSKPIKGTAPRGADAAEDLQIAQALMEDEKTRAENLMIVDLLRNDLNRVCEVDSVHVPGLFEVESFATVHQLVSTIRGRVREGLDVIDVVRAAFPGGSMTGAPKIRTMAIIDELEGAARGVYSGSIGYLSLSGTAQLNIVIRTIVSDGRRVTVGSGGAIIALSDPDDEVAEVVLKARAQRDVLQAGVSGMSAGSAHETVPPVRAAGRGDQAIG